MSNVQKDGSVPPAMGPTPESTKDLPTNNARPEDELDRAARAHGVTCKYRPEDFDVITIHTAKCSVCDQRNQDKLLRCPICSYQICTPCRAEKPPGAALYHGSRYTGSMPPPAVVRQPAFQAAMFPPVNAQAKPKPKPKPQPEVAQPTSPTPGTSTSLPTKPRHRRSALTLSGLQEEELRRLRAQHERRGSVQTVQWGQNIQGIHNNNPESADSESATVDAELNRLTSEPGYTEGGSPFARIIPPVVQPPPDYPKIPERIAQQAPRKTAAEIQAKLQEQVTQKLGNAVSGSSAPQPPHSPTTTTDDRLGRTIRHVVAQYSAALNDKAKVELNEDQRTYMATRLLECARKHMVELEADAAPYFKEILGCGPDAPWSSLKPSEAQALKEKLRAVGNDVLKDYEAEAYMRDPSKAPPGYFESRQAAPQGCNQQHPVPAAGGPVQSNVSAVRQDPAPHAPVPQGTHPMGSSQATWTSSFPVSPSFPHPQVPQQGYNQRPQQPQPYQPVPGTGYQQNPAAYRHSSAPQSHASTPVVGPQNTGSHLTVPTPQAVQPGQQQQQPPPGYQPVAVNPAAAAPPVPQSQVPPSGASTPSLRIVPPQTYQSGQFPNPPSIQPSPVTQTFPATGTQVPPSVQHTPQTQNFPGSYVGTHPSLPQGQTIYPVHGQGQAPASTHPDPSIHRQASQVQGRESRVGSGTNSPIEPPSTWRGGQAPGPAQHAQVQALRSGSNTRPHSPVQPQTQTSSRNEAGTPIPSNNQHRGAGKREREQEEHERAVKRMRSPEPVATQQRELSMTPVESVERD